MSADPFQELMDTVVQGGYCIGCGLCAVVEGSPIRIALTDDGAYQARLSPDIDARPSGADVLAVCPFAGAGRDEDEIAAELFGSAPHRRDIGHHLATYAGYVDEGAFREEGSSGGMAKWILHELLSTGAVDHVVHVKATDPAGDAPALFSYQVDHTGAGVKGGSRAAYYPVEMSEVVEHIRAHPGRYAITGVPCFIKGLRRLADVDPIVRERIRYTVGIICGHLKTTGYAESLGWQLGVSPEDLRGIDFRAKIPGRTAREKGVTAVDGDGRRSEARVVQDLFGTKYPHGFFKYNACNFCDDVLAETADVAVGDAWLPEYVGSGNSVVVVRSPAVLELVEDGIAADRLHLDALAPDRAAATQAGGLRDRRKGLAYRLHITERAGRWHPPKRVASSTEAILPLRVLYRLRMVIPHRSIRAFRAAKRSGDLRVYVRRMRPWLAVYDLAVRAGRARARAVRLFARAGVRGR